jgi:hypothetical protein
VSAADAVRRLEPMNCISWIIGHLANREHGYWVMAGQDQNCPCTLLVASVKGQVAGFLRFAVQPIGPEARCPPLYLDGVPLHEAKIQVRCTSEETVGELPFVVGMAPAEGVFPH